MSSANFHAGLLEPRRRRSLGLGIENDGLQGTPPDFFAGNTNQWPDFYTYPGNTQWLAPASTPPIAYFYPGSPHGRCANVTGVPECLPGERRRGTRSTVQVPDDYRDGRWDTASIGKLQYQKNIGSNAYVRLFGYTFYSNTNRATANGWGNNVSLGVTNYQYEVDSHTGGLEMQFADQLSGAHLLEGMVSYITSNTLRYYNHNYYNTPRPAGQQLHEWLGVLCNLHECALSRRRSGAVQQVREPGSVRQPVRRRGFGYAGSMRDGDLPASSPACVAGASMLLTYLGNSADINAVMPKITDASLSDQWRPSDAWNVNASVRFENDSYDLADTNNPATNFWFAAAQHEFCVNPVTRQPIFVPQPPQSIFFFTPYVAFNCPIDRSTGTPVQTVHPNGTDGILLTNVYPPTYRQLYVRAARLGDLHGQSRYGAARLRGPLRAAAAKLRDPIQHLQPNLASSLLGFIPFGYSSPLHEAQAQFSDNYDFSVRASLQGNRRRDEGDARTIAGRPISSTKPSNLPSLGVSPSFNAGTLRVDGVELLLTKGDFSQERLLRHRSRTRTRTRPRSGTTISIARLARSISTIKTSRSSTR